MSIWPIFFFPQVLVFLECLEKYSKNFFYWFLHIFDTQLSFKVPVLTMPYKDDWELLSLGQNRHWRHFRDHWFFISVFHCFSVQNQSFFWCKKSKNDWVCMVTQWNIEINWLIYYHQCVSVFVNKPLTSSN